MESIEDSLQTKDEQILGMITMTNLIEKTDPRYFSQTSDVPYDRHHYKIVCQNKSFVVESWDEVQEWWWNNCRSPWFEGTVIHVIDKPKKKSKGFA